MPCHISGCGGACALPRNLVIQTQKVFGSRQSPLAFDYIFEQSSSCPHQTERIEFVGRFFKLKVFLVSWIFCPTRNWQRRLSVGQVFRILTCKGSLRETIIKCLLTLISSKNLDTNTFLGVQIEVSLEHLWLRVILKILKHTNFVHLFGVCHGSPRIWLM